MVEKEEYVKTNNSMELRKEIKPKKFTVLTSVFIGLIGLSTAFLGIPIPISLYWITLTYYLYLAPIFVYTAGIMFKPWIALVICVLGLILGELIHCIIFGCSNELRFYLTFALVSQGLQVVLISLLRKRNEILALLIGGLYEALGLFIVYLLYYRFILYWVFDFVLIYALLSALLDLTLIPIALILNFCIRKAFDIKYLDELLY